MQQLADRMKQQVQLLKLLATHYWVERGAVAKTKW